jgi:predicted RNA-binding Zn ribbon-like protein
LVGGALCLDFANTSSGRGSSLCLEHLHNWQHLLAWAEHAGAIDERGRRTIDASDRKTPLLGQAALGHALRLREAIHDVFRAIIASRNTPVHSMAILNDVLSEGMCIARIRNLGDGFFWGWAGKPTSFAQLLWPIARSAAELLIGPELKRVKLCPGEGCGWLFVDRTRNGSRRWCEMEVCGSRAKMRRYHRRRRVRPSSAPR